MPPPGTHHVQSLARSSASSRRLGAGAAGAAAAPGGASASAAVAGAGGGSPAASMLPPRCPGPAPAEKKGGRKGGAATAGRQTRAPPVTAEPSFVPAEGPPPGGAWLVPGRGGTELRCSPRDAPRVPSAGFLPPPRSRCERRNSSSTEGRLQKPQRDVHFPALQPRQRAGLPRSSHSLLAQCGPQQGHFGPQNMSRLGCGCLMCRQFRSHLSSSYMSQSYSNPLNFNFSQP